MPERIVMLGNACRVLGLAVLITFLAAPVSDVAWVDERGEETRSLLGSYLAGRLARSQRENSKAAKFYENALAKDPENELILERTFLLEAIAGNWDRALRLAEDVAANENSHQIASFLLGVKEFKQGAYEAAGKHFSSARKGTLSDLTARLSRSWTYLADEDPENALKELAEMKKADWSLFYQQYHKGLIADVAGKKKTARTSLRAAFKSRPRTLRIAEAYARHASNAGDTKLAKKILKKHIGKSRGHPISRSLLEDINAGKKPSLLATTPAEGLAEVYYAIGDALTGEDSTEIGLVYLRIALYLKPDFPLANLAIGEVYDKTDRYEQALKSYGEVPKSSPIWMNIQIRKAYVLNSLEKTDDAKALLEGLADSTENGIRAFDALGSIMRSGQRYKEAELYYTRAIELLKKPVKRNWTLYYARGVSRERLKNWQDAESDLKMALKLSPNQPLILNYLGYSWVDQGLNLKRAMDLIRKAVKLKPDDGYFVDSLGWAHYRLGRYGKAAKYLERAVELRPDDPVINDHLGDAYWRVGRILEAKYQWSQALTLEPEPEDEVKIREKLANGLQTQDKPKKVVVASLSKKKTDATAAKSSESVAVLEAKPAEMKKVTEEAVKPRIHVVKEGESLWDLALEYYDDGNKFDVIYRANEEALKDAGSIRPGQKLKIPEQP
jgi:tetratricopeptide (TPR) repeat protein